MGRRKKERGRSRSGRRISSVVGGFALKSSPVGRVASGVSSAVGALLSKRERRGSGFRRRHRGITTAEIRRFKTRLIRARMRARILKEELKVLKGL